MTNYRNVAVSLASLIAFWVTDTMAEKPSKAQTEGSRAQAAAILLKLNLARCTALPRCGKEIVKHPCACAGESFPCKQHETKNGGCEIRSSCWEMEMIVPGIFSRSLDVICENPPSPFWQRLAKSLPDHIATQDVPSRCEDAAKRVVSFLSEDLRESLRHLPRTEMVAFIHGWGRDLGFLFGGTGSYTPALLADCSLPMKEPFDADMASLNLMEKVWVRLQQP
jgi:hypothetical protein